jgi:DNA-binding IclR family transcriptional regulator
MRNGLKNGLRGEGKGQDNDAAQSSSRAPAVARAAQVLRLLSGQTQGIGVSEIARRIGMVPSTCLHVLRALVDEGFVSFDDNKKTYKSGIGLLTLVCDAVGNAEFPRVVQSTLDSISLENHVTAAAIEVDNRERTVVVAVSRASSFISLHVSVGSRFPSLVSATGRCVAARSGLSREKLKKRFEALRWEKDPSFDEWYGDVERAKVDGFAIDRGNFTRGLTVLAALIPRGATPTVRGIALVGLEHHMTERVLRQLKDVLLQAVRDLGAQLK